MAISPQQLTIYLYSSAHRAVIFAIAQLSSLFIVVRYFPVFNLYTVKSGVMALKCPSVCRCAVKKLLVHSLQLELKTDVSSFTIFTTEITTEQQKIVKNLHQHFITVLTNKRITKFPRKFLITWSA